MKFLIHIFLGLSFLSLAQTKSVESLIVIQSGNGASVDVNQSIYSYNFENGVFVGKEKIMSIFINSNSIATSNPLQSQTIYKDRFVIISSGNLIDIKEKRVLLSGFSSLVRCSGDSIILFTNDLFKGKNYSYYDISTGKQTDLNNVPEFASLLKQTIEFDTKTSPVKMYLTVTGKSKTLLLNDAGHLGTNLKNIPYVWSGDTAIIFPYMKISDIEGSLTKYSLTTKETKAIGNFLSTSSSSSFYIAKGTNGFLEFYFKDKFYLVNPKKETMLISNYKDFEYNYSVEVEPKSAGRAIYYKGKEIAKKHFELKNFKSSSNYAALVKENKIGEETQQGLSIYNTSTTKWEDIVIDGTAHLIGWIKK